MMSAISQIEENPNYFNAQNNLLVQLRKQSPSAQLTTVKALLEKHPEHPWLMQQLAFALCSCGEHSQAVKLWSGWFMDHPHRIDIQNGLHSALIPLAPREQTVVLNELLISHPNSLFLQEILAVAYLNTNNYGEAIRLFSNCLQECSGYLEKGKYEEYLASTYRTTGDFDQHRMILKRTLVRDPNNWKAKLQLCESFISTGHLDTAITDSLEASKSNRVKKPELFVSVLSKALELKNQPDLSVDIWEGLLATAGNGKKFDQISSILDLNTSIAVRTWKRLVIKHPTQPIFLHSLSRVIQTITDPIIAVNIWKDLLLAHPENLEFYNNVLRALAACKDTMFTITTWKDLTMAHPEKVQFYDYLRNVLEASDEKDVVTQVWRELASSHPSHTGFLKELKRTEARQAGIDVEAACSICWDKDMDTVFYCGHTCCSGCAAQITKCPECRKDIEGRIKVYARMYHR